MHLNKKYGLKDNDILVSKRNTPFLKEKTIIIGAGYLFTGVNIILYAVLNNTTSGIDKGLVLFGMLFLIMAPIAITSKYRENRGTLYTIGVCVIYFIVAFIIMYYSRTYRWLALYLGEIAVIGGVIIHSVLSCRRRKKE